MSSVKWLPFCLKVAISLTAELDACDRYDTTAVHMAAERGHLRCLGILLDAGANCNIGTKYSKPGSYTGEWLSWLSHWPQGRAPFFSKFLLARPIEFCNSSICLINKHRIMKKNVLKSTCPTGSFACPGPMGSGKWWALPQGCVAVILTHWPLGDLHEVLDK